ncbi:VRR-NUC domain-containing protein [Parabacteroides distasonis]|uniref:VRR-NUC domain-containing protein n=1 Tax=Parabacteroides distasonis TaxID=823 RepID=UPI003F1EFD0A
MSQRLEDDLQINCVCWYKLQYRNKLITSFPAGYAFSGDKAKRAMTGKRMKDMGYLIGMPDIFIPEPIGKYPGLFIELKVGKNKTSDSQDSVLEELSRRGYKVAVCYSLDAFIKEVKSYFNN